MDIIGIAKGHHAGIPKASSKREWKLSDSLREQIAGYAREDAAQGVYMGNKFLALRKSEVAKVAPDRSALMGKVDMKTIREADERWLRILFGEPYEAKGVDTRYHLCSQRASRRLPQRLLSKSYPVTGITRENLQPALLARHDHFPCLQPAPLCFQIGRAHV